MTQVSGTLIIVILECQCPMGPWKFYLLLRAWSLRSQKCWLCLHPTVHPHYHTGWSILTVNITLKTEKISLSQKAKLFFQPQHREFLISQKFHNHSVIIHLGRLLRRINVKVWKIPWKLKFSESQFCFAYISTTEARIFMKFYMVVKYYLES